MVYPKKEGLKSLPKERLLRSRQGMDENAERMDNKGEFAMCTVSMSAELRGLDDVPLHAVRHIIANLGHPGR
jgi:hypothetical protein